MTFILEHPWLSFFGGVWGVIIILGWLFLAGVAIVNREDQEHEH
jgi:uncharacterized membrane protein YdcZ (DUF606 family)